MKNLYARVVLWLIAPAVRLQIEREYAETKRQFERMPREAFRFPTLFPGESATVMPADWPNDVQREIRAAIASVSERRRTERRGFVARACTRVWRRLRRS